MTDDQDKEKSPDNRASEALRRFESLRGLLKSELEEYGGGEAFLRWIRSEDDQEPGQN